MNNNKSTGFVKCAKFAKAAFEEKFYMLSSVLQKLPKRNRKITLENCLRKLL